jgi:calcium-dependent protein kinase
MGCFSSKPEEASPASNDSTSRRDPAPVNVSAQPATAIADTGSSNNAGFTRGNFILDNAQPLNSQYEVEMSKLGQGSYGSVTKCTNKSTKAVRACKTIPKSRLKSLDAFKQEVNIMKATDHPNIIRLFETYEDHRNVYLIMELCLGGELFDRIIEAGHLKEVDAAIIMQQMLKAVFYLHDNGIVHRDLKPENFLFLDKSPIDKNTLKLIDFGLSTKFQEGQYLQMKAGTPYYVAPEVLRGKYNKECDLWSLGVILYILICGYPPFHGETDADVLQKVKLGTFSFNNADWKNVSDDCKDLIRKLLKMNPKDRLTADQALQHVWIKNKAPRAANVALEGAQFEALKHFKQLNELKKAALQVIAQQLPDGEIDQLRKLFVGMDDNGDGQLTIVEVLEGLKKSGITVGVEMNEVLQSLDSDGSGKIDYTEFIAATLDRKKYIQEDRLWSAFRVFDLNGDGKISRAELAQVLHGNKFEESNMNIESILKDCDTDGDGEIDFEEFVTMMRRK